jgi:hypothetical protein
MTYLVEAYVVLGPEDNKMWLTREPCLDFSKARQRADEVARGCASINTVAQVIEKGSRRLKYRVEKVRSGRLLDMTACYRD